MASTTSVKALTLPLIAPPLPLSTDQQPARHGIGFVLFLVLNALLFIRPAEFIPGLQSVELFLYGALICLAFSFPVLFDVLDPRRLRHTPTTSCLVLLVFVVLFSNLAHGRIPEAIEGGMLFLKAVVYYVLFVGLVTTPARLRAYLGWLLVFCVIITSLALLQFYEVINLPGKWYVQEDYWDIAANRRVPVKRLMSTGIFADPNEFCLLMGLALVLAAYWATDRAYGLFSLIWLCTIPLFFHALTLTQSRGGLLALLVSMIIFFRSRFGWWLTLLAAMVGAPALMLLSGSRQGSGFAIASGTGQDRIGLWADAFQALRDTWFVGVGCNQFSRQGGLVAHNSYLHAYAELGLVGGTLFLSAFSYALFRLFRYTMGQRRIPDPQLRRLLPFVTALVASYMVGMMSLTLNYYIPTYAFLAIATSYLDMTPSEPPLPEPSFDLRWLLNWMILSLLFLLSMNLFVKLFLAR